MSIVPHMQKTVRFTFGSRIETIFLDLLQIIYKAYYSKPEQKSELLVTAIQYNDFLKFLLQTGWEAKLIKQSHYITLSDQLYETGKMLGGWKNNVLGINNNRAT